MKSPYPILLDLSHKKVGVVGGGYVATRKVKGLLAAGAEVTVVSPALDEQIDPTTVHFIKADYAAEYVRQMDLIFACTDNAAVNQQVKDEAAQFQLVNNVGDKHQSDFYNVAKIDTEHFMITISTNGASPGASKQLKTEMMAWLADWHPNERRVR